MSDGSTTDSTKGHGRREYLASLVASTAVGLAGCTGFVGGGGGDGDGGGGGDGGGSGSDPFASVDLGPEMLTVEIADGEEVDTVAVRDEDDEAPVDPVAVEEGIAEFPVSVAQDSSRFPIRIEIPDGEYTLVAEREPDGDGDGEEPTPVIVGERSVTVERTAAVRDVELNDSLNGVDVTVENTCELLIRVSGVAARLGDSADAGFSSEFPLSASAPRREDSPDHDYGGGGLASESPILVPGESGVFGGLDAEPLLLYEEELDGATPCTGQTAEMEFLVDGQQLDPGGDPPVIGTTTGTVTLDGGVAEEVPFQMVGRTGYACEEVSVGFDEGG